MTEKQTALSSLEIERKFLVAETPDGLEGYPHEAIRQGYLALEPGGAEVRIRQKGDRFFQTVKRGAGLQRTEVEVLLATAQFEALWPLTEGRRVEKIRYRIAYQNHVIELDIYSGVLSGLMTAEVEFASVEASAIFEPPPWFGRDVTEDNRYKNKSLAVDGLVL